VLCQYHALKNFGNDLDRLSIPVTAQIISMFQRNDDLRSFLSSIEYCLGEVEFRIEESILLDRVNPKILNTLKNLQSLGATICVENYGKGNAHFSHFQKLRVDSVIIKDAAKESEHFLQGIIGFAKGIEAKVIHGVAEGGDARRDLVDLSFDYVQGPGVATIRYQPIENLDQTLDNRTREIG
jgi:EAL domain-containing protein (putative c-di-GMP-specific phosphodiesterase class I)